MLFLLVPLILTPAPRLCFKYTSFLPRRQVIVFKALVCYPPHLLANQYISLSFILKTLSSLFSFGEGTRTEFSVTYSLARCYFNNSYELSNVDTYRTHLLVLFVVIFYCRNIPHFIHSCLIVHFLCFHFSQGSGLEHEHFFCTPVYMKLLGHKIHILNFTKSGYSNFMLPPGISKSFRFPDFLLPLKWSDFNIYHPEIVFKWSYQIISV